MAELENIMLQAYYADSQNPPKEIEDYFDKAWTIANNLKPEQRSTWINRLVQEMLLYNACLDEKDGREHLVTKMFVGFPGTNEKLN